MTKLTERQLQMLAMLAGGVTVKGMARQLYLSEHTVKCHIYHVYRILGATNGPHAVAQGYLQGYLKIPAKGVL